MKLGITYPQIELHGDPDAVHRIGVTTEQLGFDHLLTYDHVLGATPDREPKLWGAYTDQHPFHDPFVMFAYLAGITQRIDFITGILILPQRQTALVARQAADLDLLSKQRLKLGVGIGWNYVEYDALGQNFHTRGKRIEEQVEVLRRLWTEPVVTFSGRFDKIDRAALNPKPRRNIPLLMGGFADIALRRAGKMADGFIFTDSTAEVFEQASRMRELLKAEGRSEQRFDFHCNITRAREPQAVVDMALRWRDSGGTHASVSTMGQRMTTIEQHLDYMKRVADALRSAQLL